jgi:hypothetical protein
MPATVGGAWSQKRTMEFTHYQALFLGYGVAMGGWFIFKRVIPKLWPACPIISFERSWREVGWAFLACLGIIAIGQLYQAGIRLPRSDSLGQIFEGVNQLMIFSPVFLLLYLRKHSLSSAWINTKDIWLRIAVGFVLALLAILVFTLFKSESDGWWLVVQRVYRYQNLSHLIQVFCEDVTIAVLFVRIRSALGLRGTILLVAVLFALGHIPAMLSAGVTFGELGGLVLDALLGIWVIFVVQKSADILWFWMIHFAMDMMQFWSVS